LQSRPICGCFGFDAATAGDGLAASGLRAGFACGFAFGLAFAVARTAGFFAAALPFGFAAFTVVLCAGFADFLVAAFLAFGLETGRFAGLAFAAGFMFLAGAFALAAGLAARFVLARDDVLLFLLFAIDPCFPSRPARCPACPRGVLATPPLTIQCCRKERARADNARWGRSFRTS
ncbi:MAG: hypothetical protein ACREVB_03070, partial [Burkholderiales bacterium]